MILSQTGDLFKRKSIRKRQQRQQPIAPTISSNTDGKKMFENFKKISFLY